MLLAPSVNLKLVTPTRIHLHPQTPLSKGKGAEGFELHGTRMCGQFVGLTTFHSLQLIPNISPFLAIVNPVCTVKNPTKNLSCEFTECHI